MFSKRIQNLTPSPTMAVDAKAKAFKRQGIPVINLSVGEPNFQTPTNIKKAAIKAINDGHTFYTAPEGIIELREAIAKKIEHDNHVSYDPSQIIVGVGSKNLLYCIFQVLCDKGDEVIIPIPAWNTFGEQVKLSDATPVFLKLEPPFKLTANDVEKVITPKTKIILLNTPSNPTGAMIDPAELEKIAEIAVSKKIFVVTDEIYEKITYTQKHISIASLNEKIKALTILSNGMSKTYAMTGWRVGYAAGPTEIISKMKALQSQLLAHTSSISQYASVEALTGDQESIKMMIDAFAKRRKYCINELKSIDGLSFSEPEGAFYMFVSVEKLLGEKYPTSSSWAQALLENEKVAVVPGEAFLYPGYIRISYAASDEDLEEAMKRIKRFINSH
jgi:aspartate aminotransferase